MSKKPLTDLGDADGIDSPWRVSLELCAVTGGTTLDASDVEEEAEDEAEDDDDDDDDEEELEEESLSESASDAGSGILAGSVAALAVWQVNSIRIP